MQSRSSSSPLLAAVFTLGALSIAAHRTLAPYAADDAYLHFRIAENFVLFGKPYFNSSAAVLSTSSPVWTLLLALVQTLTGNLPGAMPYVSAVLLAAAGWVYGKLAELLCGTEIAWIGPAAVVLSIASLFGSSVQLMETPLALLLVGVGFLSYFQGRSIGFMCLVLASFTRFECAVFLLLVYLENLTYRRISLKNATLLCLATAMPFIFGLLCYFGTIVPQTVIAKSAIYHLTSSEFLTLVTANYFGKFVFFGYPLVILLFFTLLTVLAIYFCLFHLHPPEYVARDRRAVVILAGALLVFLAYAVKRVYVFPWYAPLYTTGLLFSLLCLARSKPSLILRLLTLTLCLPTLFVFARDVSALWAGPQRFSEYDGGVRAQVYREAGRYITQHCADCVVMAAEVGSIGYEFRGRILDAAGLVSPEAVKYHQETSESERNGLGGYVPAAFVAAAKPEILLGLDSFLEGVKKSGGLQEYELLNFQSSKALGDNPLRIYRRRKSN